METAAYSKRFANERRSYSKDYTKNNCVPKQKSTFYSFPDSVKSNLQVRNEDFPALSAVSTSSYKSNKSNCDISSVATKVSSGISYSDTLQKNTRNKTPRSFDQNINYSDSGNKVTGELHKKNDNPAYHHQAFNTDNRLDSKSSTGWERSEFPQSRTNERKNVFRNISAMRSRNLDSERTTNAYDTASGNERTENKCPQRMQSNPSMRNNKSGLKFNENEKQNAQSMTSSWEHRSNLRSNYVTADSQNQHNDGKLHLKPKRQIIAADDHSSDRRHQKDNHHAHNPSNLNNRKTSDVDYQAHKQTQLRNSDLNKQPVRHKESTSHKNNDTKIAHSHSAEVSERSAGTTKGNSGLKAGTSISRENATKHPAKSKPEPVVSKKKKGRLSKIKRQTAFQTGKVLVLSPEFHSRIVQNLSNSEASVSKNDVVDIDNLNEYPSLATPRNVNQIRSVKGLYPPQCLNPTSRETSTQCSQKIGTQCQPLSAEAKIDETKNQNFTHNSVKNEKLTLENEIPQPLISAKDDAEDDGWQSDGSWEDTNLKVKQCPRQPIQLFDILSVSKPKEKPKKKVDIIIPKPPAEKVQTKVKGTSHAPNLLDSSAPNVKRGKEREHPKQKKKTALKRIIISERMKQQELMSNMDSQASKDVEKDDQCTKHEISDTTTQDVQISPHEIEEEEQTCTDSILPKIVEDLEQKEAPLISPFYFELELIAETAEAIVDNVLELAVAKVRTMGLNVNAACFEIPNFLENKAELCESVTDTIPFDCDENSQSVMIKPSESNEVTAVSLEARESCGDSGKSDVQTPSVTEERGEENHHWDENERFKAVQAVIHVKHFREYCTQLLSKELNEAVLLLIDNLARFQDRQHQKDPVKARMKRRLTYGIKEVKKYLKLKKLRCVVIAPDLEDIKAEGGLNAELAGIIKTTKEFHIPCIFAAGRKHLGRVCHKPVPVSCLGIFSYEGSEAPYKKIIELYEANAKDYQALVKIVNCHITDDDIDEILEAKETCQLPLIALARSKVLTSILSKENENPELPAKYDSDVLQWFIKNYLHISA